MNLMLEEVVNRSHHKSSSFETAYNEVKSAIIQRGDLAHASVEKQLMVLDQLCEFPFGRYILERKGANGFWTDYLINYPNTTAAQNLADLHPLEQFVLFRSILILAHRDRFRIYQRLIQQEVKNNFTLASIPCGLMRDLITLDYTQVSGVKLVGIDIDVESIELAKKFASEKNLNAEFFQQDAWQMTFKGSFDVLTSSGLNVYEPNPEKLLDLYRRFFDALKPGGCLVTSVLTYPPGEEQPTDWLMNNISEEDLLMERLLYKDVLHLHWRNFRTISEIDKEFRKVGFTDISIHLDRNNIFPTVMARKP